MDGGRQLRRVLVLSPVVLVVLAVGFVALAIGSGVVAGTDAAGVDDRSGADSLEIAERTVTNETSDTIRTDPLANESGSAEVVVRFTPIGDPDGDGDAVVSELTDHADAEQDAFEEFAAAREAVDIESEFWLANAMLVVVDAGEVDAEELLRVANVTAVHENVAIQTFDGGTDPADTNAAGTDPADTNAAETDPAETHRTDVAAQTTEPTGEHTPGVELVGAPAAWERFDTRGAGATVAVIDTGVDPDHQDVDIDGWAEFDENGTLVSDDIADAHDPNGHGTHVAGTVAGGSASGTRIGVAPDANLYGINTFGAEGTATFASVLAGMEHAIADENVDVLQMSLGADGTFGGFIRPVRNARATDRIVVAASGNTGHGTSSSPANTYDSLAVGAVRNDRTVATFSSGEPINKTAAFGNAPAEWPTHYVVPDVTAPGVGVVSAEAGTVDGYVEQQGTSMAAPHVSGIAALAIAGTEGRIDGDDLQSSIVDTAVHPDGTSEPDDRYGYGVVDAEAAVESSIAAAPAPTPTPSPTPEETETPDAVEPAVTDDAPGFGPVVVLVALVVTAAAGTCFGRRQ